MAATDAPEAKKQKVEGAARPTCIYIVRWAAHGSNVDDWDYDELEQIETCGDDIEEAKAYITGEINNGDALLQAEGLRRDDGTVGTAFSTIEGARKGLRQCHDARVATMRDSIQKRCGVDEESYGDLVESTEIVENTDIEEGKLPSSAKVATAPGSIMATEIVWGATGYNSPDANNADQHEFIRCCSCILTRVTCWIEELELEQ